MGAPNLRAVPRVPYRPSVVVDLEHGQRMTPPFTVAEAEAQDRGPIPLRVFSGMYVAAWARAEHCPLNIIAGRFEPHCRYTPSDDLWCATAQSAGDIAGALGFAVPILLDERKRAFAAGWSFYWERS